MGTEECKKWLKWSEIGICVPQHSEEPRVFNMEDSLEKLFQRQEDMERNFNIYIQDAELNHVQTSERKPSKSEGTKREKISGSHLNLCVCSEQ